MSEKDQLIINYTLNEHATSRQDIIDCSASSKVHQTLADTNLNDPPMNVGHSYICNLSFVCR